MIVKILSSARNFEGIDYSERKNDQGWSELLKTGNFEALEHLPEITKADYVSYMRIICDANPNVKNRQFHAVISTKRNQHSPGELTIMAEKYDSSVFHLKPMVRRFYWRMTKNAFK